MEYPLQDRHVRHWDDFYRDSLVPMLAEPRRILPTRRCVIHLYIQAAWSKYKTCHLDVTRTMKVKLIQRPSICAIIRAQNTRRHAAFCRAAAVTCREALKMCGRCAARLAAMP